MFKDTVATGNLALIPSSGVLPASFETPDEELGDASSDSSSLLMMMKLRHLTFHRKLNLHNQPKRKERSEHRPYPYRAKGRKEEQHQC
jgi:hypothetical protein